MLLLLLLFLRTRPLPTVALVHFIAFIIIHFWRLLCVCLYVSTFCCNFFNKQRLCSSALFWVFFVWWRVVLTADFEPDSSPCLLFSSLRLLLLLLLSSFGAARDRDKQRSPSSSSPTSFYSSHTVLLAFFASVLARCICIQCCRFYNSVFSLCNFYFLAHYFVSKNILSYAGVVAGVNVILA